MSTNNAEVDTADSGNRWSYRVGAISALVIGVSYVITIPLFAHVGAPPSAPSGGEAWLNYLAGKTNEWWVILALSVLTDVLYVPVGLALYRALKAINRDAMLVAIAFVGLFIVLDLAVTWASFAALITLSGGYSAATDEVGRAGLAAAANYPSAVVESRLEAVYSIVTLSFAILVIGLVMLKGKFGRVTAYLALATGIVGIVSIFGWSVTIILNAVLATIWVFFVSYRLYRLSQ